MVDTGFGQALAHLRSVADGNGNTRGKLFELLVQSFLKTDRVYTERFDEVWMWKDYPGRDGLVDPGIDLVARERGGSLCAIQCKFYDEATLTKRDIDSFLEAGSRSDFGSMMLVYVGRGYGKTAEAALAGHNCTVLNFESLAESNIEWPDLAVGLTDVKTKDPHPLWEHQDRAISDVVSGLKKHDRGQLIMACGTGKTLTALRLAECIVGKGGLVLYTVPSISLMRQAIRSWAEEQTISPGYVGVCSDNTVSHGNVDIPIIEMEIGVSTDERRIAPKMRRNRSKMTVVFTTYQSMEVVAKAQELSGEQFDLVLCDEAHRTTGVERGSAFTIIHDNERIRARKRVYMTATPKLYKPAAKTKAANEDLVLYSMDDGSAESMRVFGPVMHRLTFSDAIDKNLLTDYEVIVLGVSEKYGGKKLQKTDEGDFNIPDTARMAGLYRVLEQPDPDSGVLRLQTAIAYTNRISDSRRFANSFKKLEMGPVGDTEFSCDSKHVDSTQNSTERDGAIQWLRDSVRDSSECRVVANARCLSEGVDVPALDAVAFLNPKSSEIDIIQAVGRVMRRHPGKERGYVIIPLGIPPDAKPETILDNKSSFGVVWNVLRALRSHDSRMDVEVNKADLRKRLPKGMRITTISQDGSRKDSKEGDESFPLGELDIPADALYSRIVEEVGDRQYLARWANDVADIVPRIQERIETVVADGPAKSKFDAYMAGLRDIIHGTVTEQEGIGMLAQHMITRRIFDAMFGTGDFAQQNPVSAALDGVLDELRAHGLDTELRDLERFYHSIGMRIAGLDSHDARQRVISELYGTFFKKAFPKMADRLGIVYTPTEVVDFILRSVNHVLLENFGRGLTDKNVNVIDPFTGAGTFITRLMSPDIGLIRDEDLPRKYRGELFASEIVLLAYYIAAVNCESVYGQRTGVFEQFEGLSLTDTFNPGSMEEHSGDVMAGPKRRIRRQRGADITVVIGNPPWSGGQKSANEDNPNTSHKEIETRIKETYVAKIPHIKQKRSLYNTYIEAIRWASDRIGKTGVMGFVTPSSYVTKDTMAGVRACLVEEFTDIWCFDLGGDVKGVNWREAGPKPFGSGSTVGVAITILVKNPQKTKCKVRYKRIKLTRSTEELHTEVENVGSIAGMDNRYLITPDKQHKWLGQSGEAGEEFNQHLPMGSDKGKKHKDDATNEVVFGKYSPGVGTGRDDWSYNSSDKELAANMKRHIDYYNNVDLDNFPTNSTQAKKSDFSIARLKRLGKRIKFDRLDIRTSLRKPFFKQYFHYEPVFISRPQAIPLCFPSAESENLVIIVPKGTKREYSAFITNVTPDLHVIDSNLCFPLYAYENGHKKQNITEYALRLFQRSYSDNAITRKDIFYYVYGLLHHSGYRKRYRNTLTSNLPTIPLAPDFWAFSAAGRDLAKLHLNYETCRRYRLGKPLNPIPASPRKIGFGGKPGPDSGRKRIPDHSTLVIDGNVVYDDIPHMEYVVDGRTTVQWFVDRCAFSTDTESGITNHPLNGKSGDDVRAIIERLVHVGVESGRIVSELDNLEFKRDETDGQNTQTTLT